MLESQIGVWFCVPTWPILPVRRRLSTVGAKRAPPHGNRLASSAVTVEFGPEELAPAMCGIGGVNTGQSTTEAKPAATRVAHLAKQYISLPRGDVSSSPIIYLQISSQPAASNDHQGPLSNGNAAPVSLQWTSAGTVLVQFCFYLPRAN